MSGLTNRTQASIRDLETQFRNAYEDTDGSNKEDFESLKKSLDTELAPAFVQAVDRNKVFFNKYYDNSRMKFQVEKMDDLLNDISETTAERSKEMELYKDLLSDAFKAAYAKPYARAFRKTLNDQHWHKKKPLDYERYNKRYTNFSVNGLLTKLIAEPQKIIEENKLGNLYQDAIFSLRDGIDAVHFLKPLLQYGNALFIALNMLTFLTVLTLLAFWWWWSNNVIPPETRHTEVVTVPHAPETFYM